MNKTLPLLATGIDYIPLRKELQNIAKRKSKEVVQNILISVYNKPKIWTKNSKNSEFAVL